MFILVCHPYLFVVTSSSSLKDYFPFIIYTTFTQNKIDYYYLMKNSDKMSKSMANSFKSVKNCGKMY